MSVLPELFLISNQMKQSMYHYIYSYKTVLTITHRKLLVSGNSIGHKWGIFCPTGLRPEGRGMSQRAERLFKWSYVCQTEQVFKPFDSPHRSSISLQLTGANPRPQRGSILSPLAPVFSAREQRAHSHRATHRQATGEATQRCFSRRHRRFIYLLAVS